MKECIKRLPADMMRVMSKFDQKQLFATISRYLAAIEYLCGVLEIAGYYYPRTSRVKVWYALHHSFDASVIPVFCKYQFSHSL